MKLPFDLSLKFVFRILIPGLFIALGLLPLLEWVLEGLNAGAYKEVVFVALSLLTGYLLFLLDMPIYMAYEGRRWPKFLREYFVQREARRLEGLMKIHKRYWKSDPQISVEDYAEAWVDLRQFPLDPMGWPQARYPTRLGNLITSFEEYALLRYGLNAVFLWPRLWIKLDKDLREEIDGQQAIADSCIYTSAALYFTGLAFLVYSALRIAGIAGVGGIDSQPLIVLLVIAFVSLIGGRGMYRISIHTQANFGEYFKSVFDQYRQEFNFDDVIKWVAEIKGDDALLDSTNREFERESYEAAWRYLQFYMVKLNEGPPVPVPEAIEKRRAKGHEAGGTES